MPGKAYTTKEMKVIVDYLKEHKLYSELKGRKMWMDLANTCLLDRTWQSLKETFLKRILPDIHNPYYKLTVEEISSFRQGFDVVARHRNKLEIHTVGEDSSSTNNHSGKEKNSLTEQKQTGEEKHVEIDITRSSTETLVLDNPYETADDVRKDLESPESDKKDPPKSLRDLITYSEPLTPMLQDLIDDFDTDDDEPRLQIVDQEVAIKTETVETQPESPTIRESQSYNKSTIIVVDDDDDEENNKTNQKSKIKSLKLKKTRKGTWENKEPIEEVTSTIENETNNNQYKNVFAGENGSPKPNVAVNEEKNAISMIISGTNDSESLPNNQEGLENKLYENRSNSTESGNSEFLELQKKDKKEKSRKRSRSQSSNNRKKKRKSKSREKSGSKEKDTQTFDSHPQATDIQKATDKSLSDDKEKDMSNENQAKTMENVENTVNKPNEGTSQEAGPCGTIVNEDLNPCLQSVSLYAEQFSQEKYSDLEDNSTQVAEKVNNETINNSKEKDADDSNSNKAQDKSETIVKPTEQDKSRSPDESGEMRTSKIEQMILLESHSGSESGNQRATEKRRHGETSKSVEKALANVFGFASGTVSHKKSIRNGSSSRRFTIRNTHNSRKSNTFETGSSEEYTTASDSEEREHNRRYRKYVKPPSYDILNNPEGRGLFVVGHKKLFPLLENGDLHYLYGRENPNGSKDESYWKNKYLEEMKKCAEEKIRADELARLLTESRQKELEIARTSPILQSNTSISMKSNSSKPNTKEIIEKENKSEKMIKITITRNKDIELEGQWSNVTPILEKVVALFNSNDTQEEKRKQVEPAKEDLSNNTGNENANNNRAPKRKLGVKRDSKIQQTCEVQEISSGKSTPIDRHLDPEIHEKVNSIESEIFKKILEIDKTQQNVEVPHNDKIVNPKQSLTKEVQTDTYVTQRKRGRTRKESTTSLSGVSLESTAKRTRSNAKSLNVKSKPDNVETDTASVSSRRSSQAPRRATQALRRYESDSGIVAPKLKLRKTLSNLSLNKKTAVIPKDDPSVRYMLPPTLPTRNTRAHKSARSYQTAPLTPVTSDDSLSASESTQGYQDSDVSPPKQKRKKASGSGQLRKVKGHSSPYLGDDDNTCESNNSANSQSIIPNATQNSEVYRSESYQLLFGKRSFKQLDKIDENPINNELIKQKTGKRSPLTVTVTNEIYLPLNDHKLNVSKKSSEANSSNISLPLSPELSVVENLSLSKDAINNSPANHPTLNELQVNKTQGRVADYDKYVINDIDVSLPLMEQDCELQNLFVNKSTATVSMLSQMNVEPEQCSSDSLDNKLSALLLESAKKIAQINVLDKENIMEVDIIEPKVKKARAKKRCSTPRKRKSEPASKTPNVEPVLEEHTESCSKGGRKSCPPVISVIRSPDDCLSDDNLNNVTVYRGRRKKDVIKVKILRPRDKSRSKEKTRSNLSVYTDSGINETDNTSELCKSCNVSTELIHNHSDTCLHLDECIGDSVEFIESSAKSIISLDSNSLVCDSRTEETKPNSEDFETPELFCSNAQDATSFIYNGKASAQNSSEDCTTVYHTPPSNTSFNSMITEDLSDEAPQNPSKWYLVHEQETNFMDAEMINSGSGSNLRQIFPVTCAVPNLSTITENSKDNDSKPPSSDNESIFNP